MTHTQLPHWDASTIFPGLDDPAFKTSFADLKAALDEATTYFDEHGIMLRESPPEVDTALIKTFETALAHLNELGSRMHLHYAYLTTFTSTDSRNATAQEWMSKIKLLHTDYEKLRTRFAAWIGGLDVDALIAQSQLAREHRYALHKARTAADHLMSPEEEALATELKLTGSIAWAKLFNNYTSQITATVDLDGNPATLPITAIRNLAYHEDRALRRRAYAAELAAWEAHSFPVAMALNSIKGEMNTLSRRRGWDSPLDVALYENHIDRDTLDTMLSTARDYFPTLRRYLHAKAELLGLDRLAWFDLFAPVGASTQTWSFTAARDFVVKTFHGFSAQLSGLAERAFDEHWIDAEPRDGKRGGAFCLWVRDGESRILSNFQPAYAGMATLAHELGHAYHNLARSERTYLQRDTPMTLAETASTFCELLAREAALRSAPPQEQLAILDASLQKSTQVIVDITSRFLFEHEVFERRQDRELDAQELCAIMRTSQQETYGDGLDAQSLHPYMWAVKPHYYSSTFYNFPYMFGLLFSLGVYARYRESPDDFIVPYNDLLAATGLDDAATLATRFGFDVRTPAFWRSSLDILAKDVERFEALAGEKA